MSRLKKLAANEIVYIATAPVTFTEADDQSRWDIDGFEYFDDLKNAVKASMAELEIDGLAQYLDNNLYGIVTSIIVDVEQVNKKIISKTTIKAIRELTAEEIEKLKDDIIGQFSDGWGEGFEQNAIAEYTTSETDYDEVEDEDGNIDSEPYDYDVNIDVYAHFYNMDNFNLNIKKA